MSPAELNGILRKCFPQVKRNKKRDLRLRANPKLLTPSPRTPTTDWVRGPPYRPDHGLPLRTPSTEHPENRIKIRNKYFTHGLFVQPILAWICELVPGFIICSAELQIQTSPNNLKHTSHSRIEQRMKVKNFPSYHHWHLLTLKTGFRLFFRGEWGRGRVNYICTM